MDVRNNNELVITQLAMQIHQFHQSRQRDEEVIKLHHVFDFDCNVGSGEVTRILSKHGAINEMSGMDSSSFSYHIHRALSLAAKFDMIKKIETLNDERLNSVIQKHAIDPNSSASMNEQSVNMVFAKILLEVKMPLFASVGLFKPPKKTEPQKAVYASLKSMGTDNISNYGDVEAAWASIQAALTKAPPQLTPKPDVRPGSAQ